MKSKQKVSELLEKQRQILSTLERGMYLKNLDGKQVIAYISQITSINEAINNLIITEY